MYLRDPSEYDNERDANFARACWAWVWGILYVCAVFGVILLKQFQNGEITIPMPNRQFVQSYYEQHGIQNGYVPSDLPERRVGTLPRWIEPPESSSDPSMDGIERR